MGEVYSISMNKGGVGKTSLTTNIAGVLASKFPDKKVLIIDTDGQGNASMAFNFNPIEFDETIYDVFMGKRSLTDVKVSITENLDFVPANADMNFIEFDILTNIADYPKPFEIIKPYVDEIRDEYDFIFIDTPPSMGLIQGNVLTCADKVLIPFVPEVYATQGLARIVEAIEDFKQVNNPNLEMVGVVGMMVDMRTNAHKDLMDKAEEYCITKDLPFLISYVPRSIKFVNATAYEGTLAVWGSSSKDEVVLSYDEIVEEVILNGKATIS